MTERRLPPIGRVARTVLLLSTVLGLAFMHTLGHSGLQGETAGTAMANLTAAAAPVVEAFIADPCPDGHCDGHGQHGAWSVCSAILTALAAVILAMVALLLAARRGPGVAPAMMARRSGPRAPPRSPTGLTLASTAVLRI
ncbi:DUF6153 family protein [Actinoplanes regularis]|uniref:DUF6153 family protein n=1 Tax=Actinoplanes regularis TaxID=52697 RepID=UPI0024A39B23|nr:DUF6153 family protein [Actinoplanes regularis]GLW35772.1 hypothetical protein Areg01_87070 [Actinoplanes regularis]